MSAIDHSKTLPVAVRVARPYKPISQRGGSNNIECPELTRYTGQEQANQVLRRIQSHSTLNKLPQDPTQTYPLPFPGWQNIQQPTTVHGVWPHTTTSTPAGASYAALTIRQSLTDQTVHGRQPIEQSGIKHADGRDERSSDSVQGRLSVADGQSRGGAIDPKYVAEIESSLGRLRIENIELQGKIVLLENNLQVETSKRQVAMQQLDRSSKDAAESNELRVKLAATTKEADSLKSQLDVKNKVLSRLQQDNFNLTFERAAYDAVCRENRWLKDQQSELAKAMDDLRQKFVSYTWLVAPEAEVAEKREQAAKDLESVN